MQWNSPNRLSEWHTLLHQSTVPLDGTFLRPHLHKQTEQTSGIFRLKSVYFDIVPSKRSSTTEGAMYWVTKKQIVMISKICSRQKKA